MEYRKIPTTFKSITNYSTFLKKKNYYEGYKNKTKEQNIKLYALAVYKHYKQIWLKP
jgi:hypothetical protein